MPDGTPSTTGAYFALFNEIGIIAQLSRALFEARLPEGIHLPQFAVINHMVRLGDGKTPLALARAFLHQGVKCQSMYLDRGEKGAALADEARAADAEGVIFAAPSFCDPALLDQPMTLKAVAAQGFPTTSFKYSENTGQFQVIREQTGAFADSIKIWSEA